MSQQAFEFLSKYKKPIKAFGDQELIREFTRVLMGMSKQIEELEAELKSAVYSGEDEDESNTN